MTLLIIKPNEWRITYRHEYALSCPLAVAEWKWLIDKNQIYLLSKYCSSRK